MLQFTKKFLTNDKSKIDVKLKIKIESIFKTIKVVTNEKGEAVGDVLTIIC